MKIDLSAKKAFVCGSSQGIGRAAAVEFADSGATVVLLARSEDDLQNVRKQLSTRAGQKHDFIAVDFSKPEMLQQRVTAYLAASSPIHILVNNTGGPPAGLASEAGPDEFMAAFRNHLICNQIMTQAVVPGMKAEKYGRIINIISTSVKQPIPGLGVSNTIRGAVASWAKTLATELGPCGITVNNVLPGATDTARLTALIKKKAEQNGSTVADVARDMKATIPARRFAGPEELAYAIAFLASPVAGYINGINLPVDGGRTACL